MKCFHLRWIARLWVTTKSQEGQIRSNDDRGSWQSFTNYIQMSVDRRGVVDDVRPNPDQNVCLGRSCVKEKIRLTSYSPKTRITVFFGIDGIALWDVLPTLTK
jgi:hypothetical protein